MPVKRFMKSIARRLLSHTSRPRKPAYKPRLEFESLENRLAFDNTLGTAKDLGSVDGQVSTSGFVSRFDSNDFYRFSVATSGKANVQLSGLSNNANLQLIQDVNGNGLIDGGDTLVRSSKSGKTSEDITLFLAAGTYFAGVNYAGSFFSLGTGYTVRVTKDLGGDKIAFSRTLEFAGRMPTVRDFVGATPADNDDFYRVTLERPALVHIGLSGLSANANLQLIVDGNSNGEIDPGETIATSARSGATSEEILTRIQGTFYVRVNRVSGDTNYRLDMLSDFAGDTLDLARDLGDLADQISATDNISFGQLSGDNDIYRFELAAKGNVNVQLTQQQSTSALTTMDVVRDFNNNGFVDTGDIVVPIVGSGDDISLDAGAYFLRYRAFGKDPNSLHPAETNYTLRLTSDFAGNDLESAQEVGSVEGQVTFTERIGGTDLSDFYRFDLVSAAPVSIVLKGLGSNADLRLIQDANNNRRVDEGEILASSQNGGISSEQIVAFLGAGKYFVEVVGFSQGLSTSAGGVYRMELTSDLAGNTLGVARQIGNLDGQVSFTDFVGGTDTIDFYRFDLATARAVNIVLYRLGSNADLRLIQDINNNGAVDKNEVLASSTGAGTSSEQIVASLAAGTYFVQVVSASDSLSTNGGSGYNLELTPGFAGNTPATARDLGILATDLALIDFLAEGESDFHRFSLTERENVTVDLNVGDEDVILELIHDANNNGIIDLGEVIASNVDESSNKTISTSLESGTYFVRVVADDDPENYQLRLSL
jgi:hypothetical protein